MCGFNRGTRRKGISIEEPTVGGIHGIEIAEVGKVNFNLDHIVTTELQFIENFTDDAKHRRGFSGDITEHFDTCWKIGSNQSGQKRILVVHHHLAEGRL